MSGFTLDGEKYYVEYEGLHLLCTSCGLYGHHFEGCPRRKERTEVQTENQDRNTGNGDKMRGVDSGGFTQGNQHKEVVLENWTVVQKQRCARRSKEQGEASKQGQRSYKYGVLTEMEDARLDAEGMSDSPAIPVEAAQREEETDQRNFVQNNRGRKKSTTKDNIGNGGDCRQLQIVCTDKSQRETRVRKVEKRMREMMGSSRRTNEVLMLTMGEENVDGNSGRPSKDLKEDVMPPKETHLGPYDPRDPTPKEGRVNELGGGPEMGLLVEGTVVPETQLSPEC